MRELKYFEALREATDQCMERDSSVYLMGLGVPDPKGIFGTTAGLLKKYGKNRVLDMPTAENGMTGVAIGTALMGMRPIMTHQRVDFALLALEQIVNQAAKWYYMNDGQMHVPLVIRMIVGRGWGQGPQHAQSLESWFAHIPGLKVVMPANPYDAKGLMISSIEDNNPVIFLENRWLHNIYGDVPQEYYKVPIGKARIAREGRDLTIVTHSYMVLESLRAADILASGGIDAEVIDLRTLRPLDHTTVLDSVKKTGNLLVVDHGWIHYGVSAEIIAMVSEQIWDCLKSPPRRMGVADVPIPSSRSLAQYCYPRSADVVKMVAEMLHKPMDQFKIEISEIPSDIPDRSFTGPF
ncbi:MAG: alpha-ketoacid dehydrogenase subunit beta [SAR324 cluster bacterium]|nr:alpha-ketoacid dehydrogenase subunit beta [SAR324 cluster bacterium]